MTLNRLPQQGQNLSLATIGLPIEKTEKAKRVKGKERKMHSRSPRLSLQCHTCRKRRVYCDATFPECTKCVSKGLQCAGYSKNKPLVWLDGGGSQNAYLENSRPPPAESTKRKRGRPKLVVASDQEHVVDKGMKADIGKNESGNDVIEFSLGNMSVHMGAVYDSKMKQVAQALHYCECNSFPPSCLNYATILYPCISNR